MAERAELQVTAVVVLWNSGRAVLDLLRSLEGDFARGLRVVVVDNASSDESLPALEGFLAAWPFAECVEVVHSEENLGFTGGVNLGTDRALQAKPSPEFIWLLNPELCIEPGLIDELLTVAEESGAAIVSGRHTMPRGSAESWPGVFFLPDTWRRERPRDGNRWWPVGRYAGACALFRIAAVERLIAETGYFQDPALFMYWDEWDCSHRARRLRLAVVEAGNVRHRYQDEPARRPSKQISERRRYYVARNAVVVGRRILPGWQFWPLLALRLARDLQRLARVRLRGGNSFARIYLEGTADGLRGRLGRWKRHPESLRHPQGP